MYKQIAFPYIASEPDTCKYLYAVGGYHSIDDGCPGWGTADLEDIRFIGDTMGDIVITYCDGTIDTIPLMFGYTLWYNELWRYNKAPFEGDGANPKMTDLLRSSLHLLGAYEGELNCILKIKLQDKSIKSVEVVDNPEKSGEPVFIGGYLATDDYCLLHDILHGKQIMFDLQDTFFQTHTIDSTNPYPDAVKNALEEINHATMTYEADYETAPVFSFPENSGMCRITFSGNSLADIATGVVYHNVRNLIDRTRKDGFCPESYHGAPSWRYNGFGSWSNNAGTYYCTVYSRSVAVFDMLYYGYMETAQKAANFANRMMMYFPENHLTFHGKEIPGHYTVVVNDPWFYSKFLYPQIGWHSQYTKEAFGDDYQNLGNQETDGHGLRMIDNYLIWKDMGCPKEWLEENWKYIYEGARWIVWCFENPDISFAKNDLLYAESEAGDCSYTMYCNIPCYLGMLGYAEMAKAAGKHGEAEQWHSIAEKMRDGIDRLTCAEDIDHSEGSEVWNPSLFGFYHDPAVSMMSIFHGFDTNDMDSEWVARSRRTYENDIQSVSKYQYFGSAGGVGYNHAIMTQNALLLDQMNDADKLMQNISKICYAPRLPEPYLIPEGFSVDIKGGVLRRQGDLGNLYQLADILKCYAIAIGISPVNHNTLKIMPRLPDEWTLHMQKKSIPNANGTLNMTVNRPRNGVQEATICFDSVSGFETAKFRAGPFPLNAVVREIVRNGTMVDYTPEISGDSQWFWIPLEVNESQQRITVMCN